MYIEHAEELYEAAFRAHTYLQVLLEEFFGGGTGALVAAKRVALALLQADSRQTLKAVVLEKRVEQRDRALNGPAVGRAINDNVLAKGGAIAEVEPMVVRVLQRNPSLQQLQNAEGGELADPAVTRIRRQHGEAVERAQKLGPGGPRVARRVLHEAHIIFVDRLEFGRGTELAAAAVDAAYVPYVRERTPVTMTDEDQDAAQRQVAVELPC